MNPVKVATLIELLEDAISAVKNGTMSEQEARSLFQQLKEPIRQAKENARKETASLKLELTARKGKIQ